jgi:hypothetical protein
VALLILSLALVAFGWSVNVAVRGGLWGLMAAALLFTINATTSAGAIRANQVATPWSPGTQPGQQAFMLETIKDLSTLAAGSPEALDVTVYGVETPSLRWLLRDQKATYVSGLVPDSAPSVVISPDDSGLSLGSGYRGQDFVLEATPNWVTASRADWLKWLAKREMPTDSRRVILWVRSDLFMGSEETTP